MNPIGAAILVVLLGVVLGGSRRAAVLAMFAGILYLTQGQQIAVAGFNMFAMRFLELGVFSRVMLRHEFSFSKLNALDKAFIILNLFVVIVYGLRSVEGQVYQIGIAVDGFLTYFAFRGLIANSTELRQFCIGSVIVLIPFTLLVLIESITHDNPFNVLGGVIYGSWMREGRLRCQGSFRHPSLLGTLGACMLPFYVGLILSRIARPLAAAGIASCIIIVLASNSGGPLNAAAFGVLGWVMWRVRFKMQLVRRSLVVFLIVLGFSMKAPIWYILAKMSALTGGDGWHRSYLMDVAFQNLNKWWFAGMPFSDTWDWFPYGIEATGAADITNQFISYGLTAGLGALALFIGMLTVGYKRVGKTMAEIRLRFGKNSANEYMAWSLGVVLTVHIVNWLGITYFDQTNILWLLQFAALSSITSETFLPAAESPKILAPPPYVTGGG